MTWAELIPLSGRGGAKQHVEGAAECRKRRAHSYVQQAPPQHVSPAQHACPSRQQTWPGGQHVDPFRQHTWPAGQQARLLLQHSPLQHMSSAQTVTEPEAQQTPSTQMLPEPHTWQSPVPLAIDPQACGVFPATQTSFWQQPVHTLVSQMHWLS